MSRRTNRAFVTAAVMLASFLAAIEVTVISTAMPRIAGDLGGIQLISWVFAVYLLATAVGTPIFGKLADLFGRKAVITAGMVLFLGGSLLCGLSTSMPELIGFRVVQGLGAGAVLPVALTVVGDIYELAERGRVQGLLSAIWGVASIVGPLAGGFLVDNLSWVGRSCRAAGHPPANRALPDWSPRCRADSQKTEPSLASYTLTRRRMIVAST